MNTDGKEWDIQDILHIYEPPNTQDIKYMRLSIMAHVYSAQERQIKPTVAQQANWWTTAIAKCTCPFFSLIKYCVISLEHFPSIGSPRLTLFLASVNTLSTRQADVAKREIYISVLDNVVLPPICT